MMSSGQIITISAIVAALTSAGTFFGLRHVVGGPKPSELLAPIEPTTTPPAAPQGNPLPGNAAVPKPAPALATPATPVPVPGKAAGPAQPEPPPSTVSVTVRETVTVPRVSGRRVGSARRALAKAKLKVVIRYRYDEDHSEGRVLSQRPAAGRKVAVGSAVRIYVNRED